MNAGLIKLMRPKHWVKNLFLLAPAAFSLRIFEADVLQSLAIAFAFFSMAASSVYVFNDIIDRHQDAEHPRKRNRPIPAGQVSLAQARTLGLLLLAVSFLGGWFFSGPALVSLTALYLLLQAAYTLRLKHHPVVDVICIAIGFVLRAIIGGAVCGVMISPWLLVCTFTLCLFMGFSKRRMELGVLAAGGSDTPQGQTRKVLLAYTVDLLNSLTSVSAGIAIMSFLLYCLDQQPSPFPRQMLLYTAPLVVYGVFRFALLAERGVYDGPTELLMADRPFQLTVLAWAIMALSLVYFHEPILRQARTLGIDLAPAAGSG